MNHVDAQRGSIHFNDGRQDQADAIIGADGIKSVCRLAIMDQAPLPHSSGTNTFRFLVTRKDLKADPETKSYVELEGCMDMWYSNDRKVVIYPCKNNEILNFVCIHPAHESDPMIGESKERIKEGMLTIFSSFHPAMLKMLEKADPSTLSIWPLFDMETLPKFNSGRLALVGDAAHPFLPHLGQGAAMAMEDGLSVGIMLSQNAKKDEVPQRLALYNEARYDRACLAQKYTRLTGKDGVAASDIDSSHLTCMYPFCIWV